VKLIITNYPENTVEQMEAINNPEDPEAGSHMIEFSRELWMEREDLWRMLQEVFPNDTRTRSSFENAIL
jgi:hypothetical protein